MINKLLPYEKLVYHSQLKKEELVKHIEKQIEPEKTFRFEASSKVYSKSYVGFVKEDRFEIKRVIKYRNSFLPIIKGNFRDHVSGSKVDVTMDLNVIVKVFMIVWFSGVVLGCVFTLIHLFQEENTETNPGLFRFIPFIMLIAGVVMLYIGFKIESKKSSIDLAKLLDATLKKI